MLRGHYRTHLKSLAKAIVALLVFWAIFTSQSAKTQAPLVANAYAVAPTVIALDIQPPAVTYARQTEYRSAIFDRQQTNNYINWLIRGLTPIGNLIGPNQDILYPFDRYSPPNIDTSWLDRPTSYRIGTDSNQENRRSISPTTVHRKTKPVDVAYVAKNQRVHPLHHTLYLELPFTLEADRPYTIHFVDNSREPYAPFTFRYQPNQQFSEAIHVSQIGFRPDDGVKVGFLSTWMGSGGGLSYPEGMPFHLIDMQSAEAVFSGQTTLRQRHSTAPANQPRALSDVHQLDFSSVTRPGEYRLCVDGIGCSMPFPIRDRTWLDAFYIAARGFYHQRSGIALGPPYTEVERPRPFHPDDGLQIFQSTTPLMDTRNGLNARGTDPNNFTNLTQGKTDELVANAWGGYFDAGDWDRRIQHLDVARGLLELLEQFPEKFGSFDLNLPESENDLPDVLDEALWGIDFFKRLQTPDGGIRGGIESAGHPKRGETSWQESHTVMAYAPGPWSSYIYAGVTARAARLMQQYAPSRVEEYRQSALQAMAFAENKYEEGIEALAASQAAIDAERALAALELYQLTPTPNWHALFLDALGRYENNSEKDYRAGTTLKNIEFLYARLPGDSVDFVLQQRLRANIVNQADRIADYGANTDYGWTKIDPGAPVGWGGGLGSPKATTLLRAYSLNGNVKYLESAILACQFSAGANPGNTTFTTGLGLRNPQHPLVVDQRIMGETPPPGITIYGPIDSRAYGNYWMFDEFSDLTTPPVRQWPAVETYFDVYRIAAVNEFTVMQSMLDATYAWGYLGCRN